MALYWWQIQVVRVRELENETQIRVDIENEYRHIDELTLKLHGKVSVQEIETAENIDAKGKNDLIQFRESYLHSDTVQSQIAVLNQYLVVVRQIQKDMKLNNNSCDDDVCMSYTQYINTFVVFRERYKASINKIITKQTSPIFKIQLQKAYDID